MHRFLFPLLSVITLSACEPKDTCEAAAQFAPSMELGVGERSFSSLADLESLEFESGGQGGSHVWIAAEMSGLNTGKKIGSSPDAQPPMFIVTLTNEAGDTLGYGATDTTVPQGDASLAQLTGLRLFWEGGGSQHSGDVGERQGTLTLEAVDSCGTEVWDERSVSL